MTTKEQERKALDQIRKIMQSLGEDSYINTAFAGCLEVAETNIENDWACSMKERAEIAEKKAEKLELDNRDLQNAIKRIKEESSKKITALEAQTLTAEDLTDCHQLANNAASEAERQMRAAALEIVTFAEDPAGGNFQNAVRNHRAAQRRYDYTLRLRGRIEKAMKA